MDPPYSFRCYLAKVEKDREKKEGKRKSAVYSTKRDVIDATADVNDLYFSLTLRKHL